MTPILPSFSKTWTFENQSSTSKATLILLFDLNLKFILYFSNSSEVVMVFILRGLDIPWTWFFGGLNLRSSSKRPPYNYITELQGLKSLLYFNIYLFETSKSLLYKKLIFSRVFHLLKHIKLVWNHLNFIFLISSKLHCLILCSDNIELVDLVLKSVYLQSTL